MIFVTVGTQLPFPRLIDAMDAVAAATEERVVAQVGPEPRDWPHLEQHANLTPKRFEELFQEARLIVAHAGVGTILSAKRFGKPLVILPRRHALGEHRNDHQMATSHTVLQTLKGVHIAWQADDLAALVARHDLEAADMSESPTHRDLVERLRAFIRAA